MERATAAARDGQAFVISPDLTLAEVAAIVSTRLAGFGIDVCVVGGSAITLHSADAYTSHDIDLAILTGIDRRSIEMALSGLGYERDGRVFVHPRSSWTIDIVADTPYIANRPVKTYAEIQTKFGLVRTLEIEDAIADRIAAFLFWNDSQSLEIAETLCGRRAPDVRWSRLTKALDALEATDATSAQNLSFATRRLRKTISDQGGEVN